VGLVSCIEEKCIQSFVGILKGREHLGDVAGRVNTVILNIKFQNCDEV
jgi:hypothetical protein